MSSTLTLHVAEAPCCRVEGSQFMLTIMPRSDAELVELVVLVCVEVVCVEVVCVEVLVEERVVDVIEVVGGGTLVVV
jgi:hypothetical protein